MSGNVEKQEPGALDLMIFRAAEAVAENPEAAQPHYELGRLLAEAGRPKEAERCFVRCVKIAPERSDVYHDLGVVLRAQGRFDDALASYTAAIGADPHRTQTWINIGLLHTVLERHALAEAAFRNAISLDAGSAKAWNNLGLCLQAVGRDDEAAEAFSQAMEADRGAAGVALNLALLRERQGDFDEAATLYREALRREPAHALARGNLVELANAGDPVIAETSAIVEAQSFNPSDRTLLEYALAKHFDQHGANEQAWRHAESANGMREKAVGRFDAGAQRALVERLMAAFSQHFLEERAGWGRPDGRPLFIVGLP